MFRIIVAIVLCASLVTGTIGQSDDKPYEGTSLNFLYLATAFTNGLKELEPEFEELTGISG